VQRKLYDAVVDGVGDIAGKMRIGPGLDSSTQLGPLVSEQQLERVARYVKTGIDEGAMLVAGGHRHGDRGWFHQPTILTSLPASATAAQQEIFGPVLVATAFDDVEEIAALANDSVYGLAASIWSNDLKRVQRLIPRIKAGTVWVNCHGLLDNALPFGGYKQSGIGREMGRAMIDLYTETKSVMMMY
jgi:phenylacetaldehyde dehydrogenase